MTKRLMALALIGIGFAEACHHDLLPAMPWYGWLGWAIVAALAWMIVEGFSNFRAWPG